MVKLPNICLKVVGLSESGEGNHYDIRSAPRDPTLTNMQKIWGRNVESKNSCEISMHVYNAG